MSHHTVGRVWGRTCGSRRRAQLTPKVVMAKRFAPLRPTHSRCMTARRCANVLAGGARSSWRPACVLEGEAHKLVRRLAVCRSGPLFPLVSMGPSTMLARAILGGSWCWFNIYTFLEEFHEKPSLPKFVFAWTKRADSFHVLHYPYITSLYKPLCFSRSVQEIPKDLSTTFPSSRKPSWTIFADIDRHHVLATFFLTVPYRTWATTSLVAYKSLIDPLESFRCGLLLAFFTLANRLAVSVLLHR